MQWNFKEDSASKGKEAPGQGELVIVPEKTVHTVKPPDPIQESEVPNEEELAPAWFKRKSRMVICGNFIKNEVEVYAAAANAESVRCALSVAAKKSWLAAISDICQAFTLTPISEADTGYAVLAPKVLVEAGCVSPGTAYLVERLLHGLCEAPGLLREAPRLWGGCRDKRFRAAKIKIQEEMFRLAQLETDATVWKLVRDDAAKTPEEFAGEEALALIIVYVDDVMFLGEEDVIMSRYLWVTEGGEGESGGWRCSAAEFAREKPVRYFGMELRRKIISKFTVHLLPHQPRWVHRGPFSKVPATRELMPPEFPDDDGEDKPPPFQEMTRLAQKAGGELLWLSTRTRPDLSFATSHVCNAATRFPEMALKLSEMSRRTLPSRRRQALLMLALRSQ